MTQMTPVSFGTPSRRAQATRRTVLAGTAALIPAALSACAAPGASAPAADKKPVSLRWSTWGDAANPMVQVTEKGLAIFKQKFPHITVSAEPQPSGWQEKN